MPTMKPIIRLVIRAVPSRKGPRQRHSHRTFERDLAVRFRIDGILRHHFASRFQPVTPP
jgi:hypothetical protein